MRTLFILSLFLGLFLAGCAAQSPPLHFDTGTPRPPAVPEDVTAFIKKRDLCDHFRGEEPYDAARDAFINAEFNTNCAGTDAALKQLRAQYAADPTVLQLLAGYENSVE